MSLTIDNGAGGCHQLLKAINEQHGDYTYKDWDDMTLDEKANAIMGFEAGLRNPNMTPNDRHNLWCYERLQNGWRYGKIKSELLKTNPSLVPFEMLPQLSRRKCAAFISAVRMMRHAIKQVHYSFYVPPAELERVELELITEEV